jgi:ATP-dependent DNA helicase RecG
MSQVIPIDIPSLLSREVEGVRLELKATWDTKVTGHQVLKTLCAFANDLQNLNGGYVLIGVAEADGVITRPVSGLPAEQLDAAMKQLVSLCKRIEPEYLPIMDVVKVDGQAVLALWAPASDTRPHRAPDGEKGEPAYWVRVGSVTKEAKGPTLSSLIAQTAKVPFDDRRSFEAQNDDLNYTLVRRHLHEVQSGLIEEHDAEQIYEKMALTRRVNGHSVPRNVALLFFTDEPQRWFRSAQIDVVQFADGAGGDLLEEKIFRGPLADQLRQSFVYLENLTTRHVQKGAALEARSFVSYPSVALREAIVNAVYHRSYEQDNAEPVKVYLYPDRVEVISYPGPTEGIEEADLNGGKVPALPARNRRIGELLKELRLAESRGTGLPKIYRAMSQNGSPSPRFEIGPNRAYLKVILPAHPDYVSLTALRDVAYLQATGDLAGALRRLESAWRAQPSSVALGAKLISALGQHSNIQGARAILSTYPIDSRPRQVVLAFAEVLERAGLHDELRRVLSQLPETSDAADVIAAAILLRRAKDEAGAHKLFSRAGEAAVLADPRLPTSSRSVSSPSRASNIAARDATRAPPQPTCGFCVRLRRSWSA